ncbi:WecB/TagA/CpsF family glycosyltransferase [Vibrio breoganii]
MKNVIVNGLKIYSPENRQELIKKAMDSKSILVAINAEKIMHVDEDTLSIINDNIGYPDGYGAILALKQKGCTNSVKIPGCELWLDIVKSYSSHKSFYLVGGTENTIKETVEKLEMEYPSMSIVGSRNGFFNDQSQIDKLIEDIAFRKPDIVFVAMGSPKQEQLMKRMQIRHSALYQGLGGSFDVYTGNVNRAPNIFIKLNLEWLYRLLQEPTRIKRQIYLAKFIYDVGRKKY